MNLSPAAIFFSFIFFLFFIEFNGKPLELCSILSLVSNALTRFDFSFGWLLNWFSTKTIKSCERWCGNDYTRVGMRRCWDRFNNKKGRKTVIAFYNFGTDKPISRNPLTFTFWCVDARACKRMLYPINRCETRQPKKAIPFKYTFC